MKSYDTVTANIIADSETAASERDRFNRRQFLSRIGTIGGVALSTLPAFAQIGGKVPVITPQTASLTPVVEVLGKQVWEEDRLNEDAVGEMVDRAMMKLTGRDSAKEAWRDFVLPDQIVGIKINPLAGPQLSTHSVIVDKINEGLFSAGVLRKQIIIWDRFEATLTKCWLSD